MTDWNTCRRRNSAAPFLLCNLLIFICFHRMHANLRANGGIDRDYWVGVDASRYFAVDTLEAIRGSPMKITRAKLYRRDRELLLVLILSSRVGGGTCPGRSGNRLSWPLLWSCAALSNKRLKLAFFRDSSLALVFVSVECMRCFLGQFIGVSRIVA